MLLLCAAFLSIEDAAAQTLPQIDRSRLTFDTVHDDAQLGETSSRTVRVSGTGKRKITGKKSIRGKRVRGKKVPGKSQPKRTAATRTATNARQPDSMQRRDRYNSEPALASDKTDEPLFWTRPNSDDPRERATQTFTVLDRRGATTKTSPQKNSASNNPASNNSAPKIAVRRRAPAKESGKQASAVREAFGSLAASIEKSVTQIVDHQGHSVLGTVVSTDGLIVSKNSLVDRNGRCIFSDGQQWPYRVIATDKQRDLCLIKVKRTPTVPVRFDDRLGAAHSTVPGTISVSIGRNRSVAAWGVVTLPSYDFGIEQADRFEFGALLSAFPVSSLGPVKGVEVLRVSPRTIAERMGLLVGDQIRFLNGRKIENREQIDTIVRGLRPGTLVTATVDRNGWSKQLQYKASGAGMQSMHDRWGGGPYSKRRFGFGPTLVHDSVLNPENCGGPLVGLQGQLFGINIARSMRVASLAIGSADVLNFVKSNQPQAKLRLASQEDARLKLARTSKPNK